MTRKPRGVPTPTPHIDVVIRPRATQKDGQYTFTKVERMALINQPLIQSFGRGSQIVQHSNGLVLSRASFLQDSIDTAWRGLASRTNRFDDLRGIGLAGSFSLL